MKEVSIIGIDLAKRSFQVHGARAEGSVAYRKRLSWGTLLSFSRLTAGLHGGDGGVRQRPLLGPGDRGARSRSAAGSPDLREAFRQEAEVLTRPCLP